MIITTKHWKDMDNDQRNSVCEYQQLSIAFISKHWKDMDNYQRYRVCEYQQLSIAFISKHWKDMDNYQRNSVCEYQQLSIAFISKHWKDMNNYQRYRVCIDQQLSIAFISKHWKDMDNDQRNRVCKYQPSIPKTIKLDSYQQKLRNSLKQPSKKERINRAKTYAKKYNLTIKNNYLYAYRDHNNGRGIYKQNSNYKKGKTYKDWHCDPRQNVSNSYGFGIWPKGNTKVKVPLDKFVVDVSNINDGKARVFEFTILK